jgi:hypothetical protein
MLQHAVIGNDFQQPLDAIAANWRHDPELGEERTDRVDNRSLLADEQMPGAMEHQATLLLRCLVGTNLMFGLVTASQIASASAASFFCRLT